MVIEIVGGHVDGSSVRSAVAALTGRLGSSMSEDWSSVSQVEMSVVLKAKEVKISFYPWRMASSVCPVARYYLFTKIYYPAL